MQLRTIAIAAVVALDRRRGRSRRHEQRRQLAAHHADRQGRDAEGRSERLRHGRGEDHRHERVLGDQGDRRHDADRGAHPQGRPRRRRPGRRAVRRRLQGEGLHGHDGLDRRRHREEPRRATTSTCTTRSTRAARCAASSARTCSTSNRRPTGGHAPSRRCPPRRVVDSPSERRASQLRRRRASRSRSPTRSSSGSAPRSSRPAPPGSAPSPGCTRSTTGASSPPRPTASARS